MTHTQEAIQKATIFILAVAWTLAACASTKPAEVSWKPASTAPEGKMLVTYREGESEITAASVVRENHRGEAAEIWGARDGRDTITHGSYAPPTHWLCECPPLPALKSTTGSKA